MREQDLNIVGRALDFATQAHGDQKRKYTGEAYTVHLVEVMNLVRPVSRDDEMLAAALLHDTVEDTATTVDDIKAQFGDRVAKLVSELTDVSKPEDGNRATRKGIDRAKLAGVSADAQTIKLADLISNSKSIVKYDPSFAKVYMDEKRQLLAVLTKGNSLLRALAQDIVDSYYKNNG